MIKVAGFASRWVGVLAIVLAVHIAQASDFDHQDTGFDLTGAHSRAACDSCHVENRFVGTPGQCVGCHSGTGLVAATGQPSHHALTTQNCARCHRAESWAAVTRVDHLEVIGSCTSCHDGVRARGQFIGHIPTVADCGQCHSTRSFSRGLRR